MKLLIPLMAIALGSCTPGYPSKNGFWQDLIYGHPAKLAARKHAKQCELEASRLQKQIVSE